MLVPNRKSKHQRYVEKRQAERYAIKEKKDQFWESVKKDLPNESSQYFEGHLPIEDLLELFSVINGAAVLLAKTFNKFENSYL